MPPIILLILSLVIFSSAFGYMMFHHEAEKRAIEKKRNQYNDRA